MAVHFISCTAFKAKKEGSISLEEQDRRKKRQDAQK